MQNNSISETWLTITQAATRLGVHRATLRRWADEGQIPVLLTPGGHRRFSTDDIGKFIQEKRHAPDVLGPEQVWAEKALAQARTDLIRHPEVKWLSVFPEHDRQRKRALGRYLLGLLLRYVMSEDKDERLMEEARTIGRTHAENTLQLGMTSSEALQAALFFHNAMVEAAMHLPETANIRREANIELVHRINELLNMVELAVVERYDQVKR